MPGIGKWIEQSLEKQEMTQTDLAKQLGVRPASVNHWIHERTKPTNYMVELEDMFGPYRAEKNDLAQWLVDNRDNADMSKKELADKAGLSIITINNIENSKHTPHRGTIRKLEKALGVRAPVDPAEASDAPEENSERDRENVVDKEDDAIMGDVGYFKPHDENEIRALLSDVKGVYILLDRHDRAVYVGKVDKGDRSIGKRLSEHSKVKWYVPDIVVSGQYIRVDDPSLCGKIETMLIDLLKPQVNKQGNPPTGKTLD